MHEIISRNDIIRTCYPPHLLKLQPASLLRCRYSPSTNFSDTFQVSYSFMPLRIPLTDTQSQCRSSLPALMLLIILTVA